jgi:hypothetical protein
MGVLMQMLLQMLALKNAIFARLCQTDWNPWRGGGSVKKRILGVLIKNTYLTKRPPGRVSANVYGGFVS